MSLTSALARGRRQAEALMVDSVTVTEVTGQTLDPTTAKYTDTTRVVYQGKARIQLVNRLARGKDAGDHMTYGVLTTVSLPISATGVKPHHRVTVDAAVNDPDLVGRVYTVWTVVSKTYGTARRLDCEEVQA